MTTFIRESETTRPEPEAVKSSVLAHATVVQTPVASGFGMRTEEGLWPSYNCLGTFTHTAFCPDPSGTKTFDTAAWANAFSFAVYAGVECRAIGLDTADQEKELARVFERNEGKGIEAALVANRFVVRDGTTLNPLTNAPYESDGRTAATWEAPDDLTAGMTVTPQIAFAMLEGYARTVYAGVPTLHLPAGAASFLGQDKVVWKGDKAFSHLGSKIAFGGGYDPDYTTWDGTWDMYATGEVYIEQSPVLKQSAYDLPGGRDGADNAGRNHYLTLVERMYRASVDCFVAKATGKVGII